MCFPTFPSGIQFDDNDNISAGFTFCDAIRNPTTLGWTHGVVGTHSIIDNGCDGILADLECLAEQYLKANAEMQKAKKLSAKQRDELFQTLKSRFASNLNRHQGLDWEKVQARLDADPKKLWSVSEMERTGGEPDVVGYDKPTGAFIFVDCSAESPKGRRSVCYDRAGLESRKEHRPENSAMDMAADMGIEMLTEKQYRELQKLGTFDAKTSSWLKTPAEIRTLGGAIFADFRYGTVFVYHNGAQSYYGARAFRGSLRV